jgi:chromosome segregation and condensation protein ScpB
VSNPKSERSYVYEPTTDLLSTLGISSAKELPDYTDVRQKLTQLEAAYRAKEDHEN